MYPSVKINVAIMDRATASWLLRIIWKSDSIEAKHELTCGGQNITCLMIFLKRLFQRWQRVSQSTLFQYTTKSDRVAANHVFDYSTQR